MDKKEISKEFTSSRLLQNVSDRKSQKRRQLIRLAINKMIHAISQPLLSKQKRMPARTKPKPNALKAKNMYTADEKQHKIDIEKITQVIRLQPNTSAIDTHRNTVARISGMKKGLSRY